MVIIEFESSPIALIQRFLETLQLVWGLNILVIARTNLKFSFDWTYIKYDWNTDHASLGLFSDERISEHLCQLAGSERQVGALPAQSSNAFLQGQQRLVDLRTLHACKNEHLSITFEIPGPKIT